MISRFGQKPAIATIVITASQKEENAAMDGHCYLIAIVR